MSRTQRIAIALALVGAHASQARAQVPADVRSIKPVMMLLVDTSGSMERMTDDSSTPVCRNNPTLDVDQRNRWTVTLEALTGTFNSFSCSVVDRTTALAATEMDYGYYLPHFEITSPTQSTDGIMDAFLHRLKFGLMTFDGAGTTLNGDSLVAAHTWMSDSTFRDDALGSPGMYSYGPNRRLSFPGCLEDYGVNAGARSSGAPSGGLVSVGSDGSDVVATNAAIQAALRNVRPFGSTPLAAMFDDLDYYLTTNDDVRDDSDPFYECRNRYALLITDSAGDANELFRDARFNCQAEDPGLPGKDCAGNNANSTNLYQTAANEVYSDKGTNPAGDCECPYDTELDTVKRLVAGTTPKLHKLFIVAFNVQDQTALDNLDALAAAGESDAAFKATSQSELRARLSELMSSVQGDATTRSVPVSVDTGSAVLLNGKQYEITAGFKVGTNVDDPWTGLLYRRRIGCGSSGTVEQFDLSESDGDLFHETLNSQADNQRSIRTLSAGTAIAAQGSLLTDAVLNDTFTVDTDNDQHPTSSGTFSGALPTDSSVDPDRAQRATGIDDISFSTSIAPVYFGDANGNGTPGQNADRDIVVDYVRGRSRPGKKLADIYYSSPVVLPPVNGSAGSVASADERLSRARLTLASEYGAAGRPGVVFVGTNDGILHAFNLDTAQTRSGDNIAAGRELWGFVPPALFSKMHTAAIPTHVSMFDGTPTLADIMVPFRPGESTTFKTALVSNVRGAPAYVALDVTYPETLTPLWQFSDEYMGETVGRAAITHVKVDVGNGVEVRAVAILPGGSGSYLTASATPCTLSNTESRPNPGTSRTEARCWKAQGRSLYVVDILTGKLIQRFDPRHFNAPMTGSAVAENPGLGTSQAAYMTDEDGILWRLSMVSTDPTKWRVQPIWDIFGDADYDDGRPATFPPIVTRDVAGNVVVVVGTGDLDNLVDSAAHRVVSLTEKRSLDGAEIAADGDTVSLNWKVELQQSESVTGPLVLFQNTVYFGTFRSISDAGNYCALGDSKFWGAHAWLPEDAAATNKTPKPMLDIDANGDGIAESVQLSEDAASDTLVLGVSITRQPVCVAGSVENDPNGLNALANGGSVNRFSATGAASGGGFTLRALAGGSGGVAPTGSEIRQIERKLTATETTSVSSWAASVE